MGDRGDKGRSRARYWVIVVRAIDPGKYPKLQADNDNPFSRMDSEARIEELSTFCARLWARTCEEAARMSDAPDTTQDRAPLLKTA